MATASIDALLSYMDIEDGRTLKEKMERSGKPVYMTEYQLQRKVVRSGMMEKMLNSARKSTAGSSRAKRSPRLRSNSVMGLPEGIQGNEEALEHLFDSYSGVRGAVEAGEEVSTLSLNRFQKLVRDAQILDNHVTQALVELVFLKVLRSNKSRINAGMSPRENEVLLIRVPVDIFFLFLLPELASLKFGTAANALPLLVSKHLLPLSEKVREGADLSTSFDTPEELLDHRVWKRIGEVDYQLRQIFHHYATLDFPDGGKSSHASVDLANRTLSHKEFAIFASNFDVSGTLLSKRQLHNIFIAANQGAFSDEMFDRLSFPEFLESLGRIALLAFPFGAHDLPATLIEGDNSVPALDPSDSSKVRFVNSNTKAKEAAWRIWNMNRNMEPKAAEKRALIKAVTTGRTPSPFLASGEIDRPRPLFIAAPTGCSHLAQRLLRRLNDLYPSQTVRCVNFTTRGPFEGETDGIHYHFITRKALERAQVRVC